MRPASVAGATRPLCSMPCSTRHSSGMDERRTSSSVGPEDREHGATAHRDLVEQFYTFQRKQRGKIEGGVRTYRWNLGQYLTHLSAVDAAVRRRSRADADPGVDG